MLCEMLRPFPNKVCVSTWTALNDARFSCVHTEIHKCDVVQNSTLSGSPRTYFTDFALIIILD